MLIRSDEDFNTRLDQAAAEHAKKHNEQLTQAALEHERVRQGAERECQRLILLQELERQKQEEAQRWELERIQREKEKQEAEKRQREVAAKQREEEAARKAEEQKKLIAEAEARLKAQKEQEEAVRKQKIAQDEADRKAKEAAIAAEKARIQAAQQQAAPAPTAPTPSTAAVQPVSSRAASNANLEEIHTRYLQLHRRMKAFWQPFKKAAADKANPLKAPVGDMRREMRKATGQVTVKREESKVVITKLREIIRKARAAGGPTIDIRPFILSYPIPTLSNEAEAQYPAILLYAFICFEKFVVKQFQQEAASDDGKIIQELGAIAASLFVDKEFAWNGIPMIDLLLAKLHKACPLLFGISGDMATPAGRERLGWIKISGDDPDVNTYNQRMLGLACGFASLSLRIVAQPAIPMSEYWRAISSLCNTPPDRLYSGHFMVIKGLVRDFADKFLKSYGVPAKAVLRRATITLPMRAPDRAKDTASLVKVLPDAWKAQNPPLRLD